VSPLVAAIVFVAAAFCVGVGARRDRSSGSTSADAAALGLGLLVHLLAVTIAWLHYFVLIIPAWLMACRPAGRSRFPHCELACLVILLVSVHPLRAIFDVTGARAHGWTAISGVLVLYAMMLHRVASSTGNRPSAEAAI